MLSIVRGDALFGALLLAASLALVGCGSGPRAGDGGPPRSSADSVDADVGDMQLRHVHVESPSRTAYRPGDDAGLFLTILNGGDTTDALTGVTTAAADRVVLREGGGQPAAVTCIAVSAHGQVSLQRGAGAHLELVGLHGVYRGTTIKVTFAFQHAGRKTLSVPVQTRSHPVVPPLRSTALARCPAASPSP